MIKHLSQKRTYHRKALPSNWRSRLELVQTSLKTPTSVQFSLQFRKGKTPKGYCQSIGFLVVESDTQSQEHFVAEIDIYDGKMKKRGLGTMMCEAALLRLGSITTTFHNDSRGAKQLWKSLCRKYAHETEFWTGKLTIYGSQTARQANIGN